MESNFWYLNDAWLDQMDAKLEESMANKSDKKKVTKKVVPLTPSSNTKSKNN